MPVPPRVYSVYKAGRLVLVIRSAQAGELRRAGARGQGTALAQISYAECTSFSAGDEPTVLAVAAAAKGLDQLLFKLKLEGYELRDGEPRYDLPYRRW